jgi:TPR repeat protein
LAAEQGNSTAQGYLCDLYTHGKGVKKDYEKALKLCR